MGYLSDLTSADSAAIRAATFVDLVDPSPIDHEAIMAEVTPWVTVDMLARRARMRDEPWQTRVRKYDREGPGIVGAAVDLPAATSSLLTLVVQEETPQGWETIDDPYLMAVLSKFRGKTTTQNQLFSHVIRTLDLCGEAYLVLHNPTQGVWYWQLAQTTNVSDRSDGFVDVKTRKNAQDGSPWHFRVPDRQVFHFHLSDNEWADEAWSPLRRGLDDLERYRAAMRNVGRNLDSQLAMNGILWAKAVSGATNWSGQVKAWAAKAIQSEGEDIEAVAPFMMSTVEEPKFINTGRGDHSEQLAVADAALLAFARSQDIPTNMLIEGPGSLNHWNSYLEGDFYADMTMQPRWARAASIVTETHFRPFLRALPSGSNYDISKLRVWCDDVRLRTKTDNTDRVIEGGKMGLATREAYAEAIGLRSDQILTLPDGVTEQEWLLIMQGSGTDALQVERNRFRGDMLSPGVSQSNQGNPEIETSRQVLEAELVVGKAPTEAERSRWDELVPT